MITYRKAIYGNISVTYRNLEGNNISIKYRRALVNVSIIYSFILLDQQFLPQRQYEQLYLKFKAFQNHVFKRKQI